VQYAVPVRLKGMSSAYSLGEWTKRELGQAPPDTEFILRVLPHEIDKWFKAKLTPAEIRVLTKTPPETGDDKWNALIEGIVLYRCRASGITPPSWVNRTKLSSAWNPKDELVHKPSLGVAFSDIFATPTVMLDKGVHFSRQNMLGII